MFPSVKHRIWISAPKSCCIRSNYSDESLLLCLDLPITPHHKFRALRLSSVVAVYDINNVPHFSGQPTTWNVKDVISCNLMFWNIQYAFPFCFPNLDLRRQRIPNWNFEKPKISDDDVCHCLQELSTERVSLE